VMSTLNLNAENSMQSTAQVTLNVGGAVYCTTANTLCGAPFFKGLLAFEDKKQTTNNKETKNLFVDRDGPEFAPILSFLRTGEFVCPKNLDIIAVLREADFYGVVLPLSEAMESSRISWLDDEWLMNKMKLDKWNSIRSVGDKFLEFLLNEFRACADKQTTPFCAVWIDKDSFIQKCRTKLPSNRNLHFESAECSAAYDRRDLSLGNTINTEFFQFLDDEDNVAVLTSYCASHNLSLSHKTRTLRYRDSYYEITWQHIIFHAKLGKMDKRFSNT